MHSLGFHLGLYILHTLMTIISTDKWPRHEEQNSETYGDKLRKSMKGFLLPLLTEIKN